MPMDSSGQRHNDYLFEANAIVLLIQTNACFNIAFGECLYLSQIKGTSTFAPLCAFYFHWFNGLCS